MMKICTNCGISKTLDNYSIRVPGKPEQHSYCKKCNSLISKDYYNNNKNKVKDKSAKYYLKNKNEIKRRNNIYLSKYKSQKALAIHRYWPNLNYKEAFIEFNKLKEKQNNLCAICNRPETNIDKRNNKIRELSVDHNHRTGKVRGLLCGHCNKGIGLLKLDNGLEVIYSVIDYIKEKDNE